MSELMGGELRTMRLVARAFDCIAHARYAHGFGSGSPIHRREDGSGRRELGPRRIHERLQRLLRLGSEVELLLAPGVSSLVIESQVVHPNVLGCIQSPDPHGDNLV